MKSRRFGKKKIRKEKISGKINKAQDERVNVEYPRLEMKGYESSPFHKNKHRHGTVFTNRFRQVTASDSEIFNTLSELKKINNDSKRSESI